jgi:hypothetical protein
MINQTQQARRLPALDMPSQSAPIARAGSGAVRPNGGVEADGWFDDVVGGISDVVKVGQAAAPLIGSLAGLI